MYLIKEGATLMNQSEDKKDLFLHGSTWMRADFHLHTAKDKEFTYNGELNRYVEEYVNRLQEANIKVGMITNHNKFDMDEFKALRKRANKAGVFLLPGVELSVGDGQNGIHVLIGFADEWIYDNGVNYIQQFLTSCFAGRSPQEYEQENQRSNENLLTTLEKLSKFNKDFFAIFAHVEQNNGLWTELEGGRISELGNNELFKKYTLGFQKVRTHDKGERGHADRMKVKNWLGQWYPAEVEGSDCKSIQEIGKGKECYIKIGEFSFDAVKFALKDYQNHVASEAKEYKHSYIRSIAFEGGKLGGQTIFLSPEINTLIGIRGSGKSSILEVLRYTLGVTFSEKTSDRKYKEELVGHFLGSGGKVVVTAVDRHGEEYEIRRIWKEQPDVYVKGTLRPGISIRETIINKPIYFGQKDLSSSGEGFERELVEKLLGEQLAPIRYQIEEQKQKVKLAAEQVQKLSAVDEKIEDYRAKRQDAEFRLQVYKKHGIEERLQKQLDFDADTRYLQHTGEKVARFLDELESVCDQHEDELKNQQNYHSKQNTKFFASYQEQFSKLIEMYEQVRKGIKHGREIFNFLNGKSVDFEKMKFDLKEEFAQIERQLSKELNTAGITVIRAEEYRELSKKIEQAKLMLDTLEKQKQQECKLKEMLFNEMAVLNDLWHQEYRKTVDILSKVNDKNSSLKITVTYKSDKQAGLQYLESMVRGTGIRKTRLSDIVERYTDFGEIYKDMDNIMQLFGTSGAVFEETVSKNLSDLVSWQVPNQYKIEYRGKELKHHSLGQRASALILFVLSQEDNDVFIIDQPEDDLDNQTIYEDVIKLLRQLKYKTQFIFATHNANFPVLGEAEQVLACEYEKVGMTILPGSIDNKAIQNKIVAIMEGGREAFQRRKEIYDIWTRQNY